MTASPLLILERSVRRARRRLILQQLLDSLAVGLTVGLALGLIWFLLEPWLIASPPDWLRWSVLGGIATAAILAGIVRVILTVPTRVAAALELDRRFDLRERITTALELKPNETATPAGQAVVEDASTKVAAIHVGEKFPIRPSRSVAGIPTMAALIAFAFFFYHPDTTRSLYADDGLSNVKKSDEKKLEDIVKKPELPFTKRMAPEQLERKKSAELEKLEQELDKLMDKWSKDPTETEEKKREKVTQLTAMEEKIKKFKEDEYKKLNQLEKQLQQLERLTRDKEFEEGPMKDIQRALSKGDLKKAEEAVEELKKKIHDKTMTPDDMQKLDKQIEKLKEEAQKAAKDKEKMDALKKKIEQAKKEGKDAEGLERELEKMSQEAKDSSEMMERMAEQMKKMQQAMKQGDMEQAEQAMEGLSNELKNIQEELKDLEDADDYLQRLREDLKKACEA